MTDTRTESSLQAGLKKSTFQLFLTTGAWVGSTALMSFGPSAFWDFDTSVTFLAIAANLIVGGFMLYSFFRHLKTCLLYTSPSPRDGLLSRMPSSA